MSYLVLFVTSNIYYPGEWTVKQCVHPCPRFNGWGHTSAVCSLFGSAARPGSSRGSCLSAPRFWSPGTYIALRDDSFPLDHRRIWCASLHKGRDLRPPRWFKYETTDILSLTYSTLIGSASQSTRPVEAGVEARGMETSPRGGEVDM